MTTLSRIVSGRSPASSPWKIEFERDGVLVGRRCRLGWGRMGMRTRIASENLARSTAGLGCRRAFGTDAKLREDKRREGLDESVRRTHSGPSTRLDVSISKDVEVDEDVNACSTPPPAPTSLSTEFRNQMRKVTHPVVVITSSDLAPPPLSLSTSKSSSISTELPRHRGATVSSFNSVTLSPHPYVSFNIKQLSSTYDAIRHSGRFAVHILGESEDAVDVASKFARGNNGEGLFFEEETGKEGGRRLRPWIQKPSTEGEEGGMPPLLKWDYTLDANTTTGTKTTTTTTKKANTVLFIMLCHHQPDMTVQVGDHVVVVGRVVDVITDESVNGRTESSSSPSSSSPQQQLKTRKCLTYDHGRYSFTP